jgi:hypothetical protein
MKYLITSIKEIEDLITPSLDVDDIFNPFTFSKFEKQFRSCMRLYRIETFGEDFEKFPISFEEFNHLSDKFYGLNYNRLEEIVDFKEFNSDLNQYFINCEDLYLRDIFEQLQNPVEAQFKIYLFSTLKNLQDSYDFLISTEIKNNVILNIIKNSLLDSYHRAFKIAKKEIPVYNEIFNTFLLGNPNQNTLSTNVSINERDVNPFPRLFINYDSFLFFEELKNKLCTNENSLLADFSFVFRMMQKEGNIYDDVTEKSFRNFLTNSYEINFEKLKTYEYSVTDKKIQLYNLLKK